MIREMRKIITFAGSSVKFILLLLLRCPFDATWTIVNAVFLQNAFNATVSGDSKRLVLVCSVFGALSLCLFLYNGIIWSIYAPFVTSMEGRLRRKLFSKISALSYESIEATPIGEWVTRLNVDVQLPFSNPLHLPHAVCSIVNIVVSSVILFAINPKICGWVLLFVIPHILISNFVISMYLPELNKKSLEATAKNAEDLTAIIICNCTSKLYDAGDFLLSRFEQSSLNLCRANMKIRIRNVIGATILPLFAMGGYVVLLVICGEWIARGSLTFGDLTAAFQYRGGVLVGTMMLINSIISIKASMAGICRINEIIE